MTEAAPKIVLLCKEDTWSRHAVDLATVLFGERLSVFSGRVGSAFPDFPKACDGGWLFSFLSPWIVPEAILSRMSLAINFHPGSCDYPGIGCYNFAIYEQTPVYGPVCHHMKAKVDTGAVIMERLFPVLANETVEGLKLRTMVTMLNMFHDVLCLLIEGKPLPTSSRQWTRRPFLRRELEELGRLSPSMSEQEKALRIRAMTYPGMPGAYYERNGEREYVPSPNRPPLA